MLHVDFELLNYFQYGINYKKVNFTFWPLFLFHIYIWTVSVCFPTTTRSFGLYFCFQVVETLNSVNEARMNDV